MCGVGGSGGGGGGGSGGSGNEGGAGDRLLVVVFVVLVVLFIFLALGDRRQCRRQRGGIDCVIGYARKELVEGLGPVEGAAVAVLGAEELLGEGRGRAERGGCHARVALQVVDLLHEGEVRLSGLEERVLEYLIPVLQGLDLEALPLARRLSCPAVPKNTLDSSLLFLVVCLGAFPVFCCQHELRLVAPRR